MDHSDPCSSHPEIDAAELVLVDREYEPVPRKPSIPGTTLAKLTDEPAPQAARLWPALPPREPSRAHPLATESGSAARACFLVEAALCFHGDNGSRIARDEHDGGEDNGSAPESAELRALFRSHDPSPVERS